MFSNYKQIVSSFLEFLNLNFINGEFSHYLMTYWLYMCGAAAVAVAGTYILWGPPNKPSKKKRNLVPGLQNLGNTCFLNAVLQALSSCLSCVDWLHKAQDSAQESNNENCFLIKSLLSILSALNKSEDDCSCAGVIRALRTHRWLISNEENDAHELFHVLTTTVEEEILSKNSVLSLLEVDKLEKGDRHPEEVKKLSVKSLPMKLAFPMRGLLVNELKCNSCMHRHPAKYDAFDSISLAVPSPAVGQVTLHDLLSTFISCVSIQDVICEICPKPEESENVELSVKTTFSQQVSFGKLPECLCIHIQRTVWLKNGLSIKCYDYVSFPEVLNMDYFVHTHTLKDRQMGASYTRMRLTRGGNSANYLENLPLNFDHQSPLHSLEPEIPQNTADPVNDNSTSSHKYPYLLKAVIVHLGDVTTGHFITYRRVGANRLTDKWFYISDLEVREVAFSEVIRACAYMLFYEKIRE